MDVSASAFADRDLFRARLGDPSTWEGDWRREGNYLQRQERDRVAARLARNGRFIVGLCLRNTRSTMIAALFVVSREAVDRRLRPLGLKNQPGHPGRRAIVVPSR